jgi:hypothetical protein
MGLVRCRRSEPQPPAAALAQARPDFITRPGDAGAYIDLGRAHAEHAGERYVPASQSAPADSGRH